MASKQVALTAFLLGCGAITGISDLENVPSPSTAADAAPPKDDVTVEPPAGRCDPAKPFGEPILVDLGAPDGSDDADARLSEDEKTIYFQSTRDNSELVHKVYQAVRADTESAFLAASIILEDGNTSFFDPVVTPDRLTLIVQRGVEGSKIQYSTRPDPGADFPLPLTDIVGIDSVVPEEVERDPYLAPDGRILFTRIAPGVPPDVYIAAGSIGQGYNASALNTINTEKLERNPVLSADGMLLFFTSDRTTVPENNIVKQRIFTATRASANDAFGAAAPLENISPTAGTHDYDAPTWISKDGCVFYFASNRAGNGIRVYVTRRGK